MNCDIQFELGKTTEKITGRGREGRVLRYLRMLTSRGETWKDIHTVGGIQVYGSVGCDHKFRQTDDSSTHLRGAQQVLIQTLAPEGLQVKGDKVF